MEDVTAEKNWTSELGVGDGIDIPIYVIVGSMQRDQFNQQKWNKDTFYRPNIVNVQCIFGNENLPDAGRNLIMLLRKIHKHMVESFPVSNI